MKKALSFAVTFLMLVNLCLTTFAVETTPSVEAKLAPAVVEVEYEGQKFAALLIDAATGKPIEGIDLFGDGSDTLVELCLLSLADAESAALSEITEDLYAAKAEIDAAESFDDLGENLTKQINEALAKVYSGETGLSANNMAIGGIYDASLIRDKAVKVNISGQQLIQFALKPGFKKDQHPILLHRIDDEEDSKWRVESDMEWIDEETVKVTTDTLSVFAFVVDKSALDVDPNGPTSPQTGDDNTGVNFLFGGIAVVCAAAAGYFLVKMSRKEKAE